MNWIVGIFYIKWIGVGTLLLSKSFFSFSHLVIDGNVNTGMADEEEKERKRGVRRLGEDIGSCKLIFHSSERCEAMGRATRSFFSFFF